MRRYYKFKLVLSVLLIATITLTIGAINSDTHAKNLTEIKINIPTESDAKKMKGDMKYCVYGPYDKDKSVEISLKNDIYTHIEVITAGENYFKNSQMVSNCISKGTTLEAIMNVTANDDGQYYIFVGAEDIKNLTGTLKMVENKSSNYQNNDSWKDKEDDEDTGETFGRIINNGTDETTILDGWTWSKNTDSNNSDVNYPINVVEHLENVSSDGINEIHIKAHNFGVLVEKSEGNEFEFEAVGVKDRKNVLSYNFDNSNKEKLTIDVKGSVDKINIDSDRLVNVFKIKVPQKQYDNFYVDIEKEAVCRLPDMNTNMILNSFNSDISVIDKNITSPIILTSDVGDLSVQAEILSSPLIVKNNTGYTKISIDEIKNNITIGGRDKENTTGYVKFIINKYPKNLSFELNTKSGIANLPQNWNKNMSIGNGIPLVKIFNNSGYTKLIVK